MLNNRQRVWNVLESCSKYNDLEAFSINVRGYAKQKLYGL